MDLSGIISIGGMPGLYKVVAQSKNGVIVENLSDKKRFPAFSTSKISALEDISIYTEGDNRALSEILKSIYDKENGKPCIDHKAADADIISYFSSILPDYDKDRVFVSNMKKVFQWYNLLESTGNLKLKQENEGENTGDTTQEKKVKTGEEKPVKKKTAKASRDNSKPAKQSAGIKKAAGVRKTGSA